MCIGVIGRIRSVEGYHAKVDFGGLMKTALVTVDELGVGDFVIVHAGVIIERITPERVVENMALIRDLLAQGFVAEGMEKDEALGEANRQVGDVLRRLGLDVNIADKTLDPVRVEAGKEGEPSAPSNAFKCRYRVSLSDTDYLQVLHYTNYLRFCERAQQELLEELGFSYSTLIHRYGLFVPTVESWGKYLSPTRIDNLIEVAVWVEEIGRKHIKFRYIVHNLTSGKTVAECYTVSVCTDVTLMESMPLPEELVKKLQPYVYSKET